MEVQALPESTLIQAVSRPLYETRNWLRLIGITQVVFAALGILGILIYLAVGISLTSDYFGEYSGLALAPFLFILIPIGLAIWQSILLIQAGNSAQAAGLLGDKAAMIGSLSRLKTYFTITGILLLIGIAFSLLSICASIFIVASNWNLYQ